MNYTKLALGTVVVAAVAATAFGADDALEARVRADFPEATAPWVHYAVPAMSNVRRLPDAYPADGRPGATNRIVMARGEYEPMSVLVYARRDLGKVSLKVGELRTDAGAVFPADGLDLKVVKCWYQCGNAWYSYFGDTGNRLVPELLLHDDDLIRVDRAKGANYARLVAADGTVREKWLNEPPKMEGRVATDSSAETFRPMAPDFRDAPSIRPVSLPKGEFRDLWLTAHATQTTKPGLYRGAIVLADATGASLGEIPVEIRVLDFDLPAPRSYGEPSRDFLVTSYSYIYLEELLRLNGGDLALAKRQLKAILANQVAHNQTMHWLRGDCEEETRLTFEIMKEVGMRTDVITGGLDAGGRYWGNDQDDLNHFRRQAKARREWADRVFGHHNVYLGFGDEPPAAWIMKHRDVVYRAYAEQGFKFVMAGWGDLYEKGFATYDWANIADSPTTPSGAQAAAKWAKLADKRIAWYANHHVGPENPDFNRRQNGLGAYLNGFNALCNYAHHLGPYNDRTTLYKPMVLAYGAYDGVLDTIAWEGFREGIDDIRYATLLADLARQAARHGDFDVRRAGQSALKFVASLDPAKCDQNAFRAEAQRWIVQLKADVARAPKPVPEFVPPADEKLRARQTQPIRLDKPISERTLRQIPSEARAMIEKSIRFDSRGNPRTDTNGLYRAAIDVLRWDNLFSDPENALRAWDFAESLLPNVSTNATMRAIPARTTRQVVRACCRLGEGAKARAVAERCAPLDAQAKPAERFEIFALARLSDARAGDVAATWKALVAERGAGVAPKDLEAALCAVGVVASEHCDAALVQALEDVRLTLVSAPPRKTYVVKFSERPVRSGDDFDRLAFAPERQVFDRRFGGNVDFLYTDVSSGARAAASANAKETLPPPTMEVVANEDGLHFRFVAPDPKAQEVAFGLAGAGSYEFYLAAGRDAPYVCGMMSDTNERGGTLWNTMYTTEGHHRIETADGEYYRMATYMTPTSIVTTLDFSWRAYAERVPRDGDVWNFENVRWSRTGSAAWNGLEGVHARASWGDLRFEMPDGATARIVRRQLFRALGVYKQAKGLCGAIGKWNDSLSGDVAFYESVLKPLIAKYDAIAERITLAAGEDEILRIADEVLAKWLCLGETVGRLRTDYLNAK